MHDCASPVDSDVPLGHILVEQKLVTRRQLNLHLETLASALHVRFRSARSQVGAHFG